MENANQVKALKKQAFLSAMENFSWINKNVSGSVTRSLQNKEKTSYEMRKKRKKEDPMIFNTNHSCCSSSSKVSSYKQNSKYLFFILK